MVLRVSSKFTPYIINEGLRISKVFLEKDFELWPSDWSGALVTAFMLGLSKVDGATKEFGSKQDTIHPGGT